MALALFLVFFLLVSSFLVLGFGKMAYSYSYLGNRAAHINQPLWENIIYYCIAAYPALALITIALTGEYLLADNTPDTIPEMKGMLIFCTGHFILCILSVTVTQFLQSKHKANVAFIISNVIAGGGYMYAGLFAFIELIKH